MNQKGFANIVLIVLVVVLAGAVGYVTLIKKPAPVEQTQTNNPQNTQPTTAVDNGAVSQEPTQNNTAPQNFIKITSPANGVKIDPYADFTVRWETSPNLRNETLELYVSGAGQSFTCLPEQDGNRGSDYECTESLVARVPALNGSYILKINPGCKFEMPVHVRVATKGGTPSDSVGPIILQGGACGPG